MFYVRTCKYGQGNIKYAQSIDMMFTHMPVIWTSDIDQAQKFTDIREAITAANRCFKANVVFSVGGVTYQIKKDNVQ